MITVTGAAFGAAGEGDGRSDPQARTSISARLGIPAAWAWVRQVHGVTVVEAVGPGPQGDADAVFTRRPGLPVAVATADCLPVALHGDGAAAVVHAGWRGAAGGVVGAARAALEAARAPAARAAIGPGIGPCCYEVGPEVRAGFPEFGAETTWGTPSVDLAAAVRAQLDGLDVWDAGVCTRCDARFHSYRRDRTDRRQVAVAWLPTG